MFVWLFFSLPGVKNGRFVCVEAFHASSAGRALTMEAAVDGDADESLLRDQPQEGELVVFVAAGSVERDDHRFACADSIGGFDENCRHPLACRGSFAVICKVIVN